MIVNKVFLSFGIAVLFAAASLSASAQTAPVHVVSVTAFNGDTADADVNAPPALYIQFENTGTKTAKTIVFELQERVGRSHNVSHVEELGKIRQVGSFAPNVPISKALHNRWATLDVLHTHNLMLVPVEVDYVDGTSWKAAAQ